MLRQLNLPDLYLEDALPFIDHVLTETYDEYPKVSEVLMNVKNMPYGIAQTAQVSSLSAAGEVAEGEEIPQQRVYPGFSTTYKSKKYGLLLSTTQEVIDHEKYDSLSKNPRRMARAMASTIEIVSANVFNSGFGTNGSDGVPLFSASHPLLSPGAGLGSNLISVAADLSTTSIKDLLTVMRKTLDTSGNRIQIRAKQLVVPAELEFAAWEILKSVYLADSPNNNLSSIGPQSDYRIEPVVWNYLTDADAFFLLGAKDDHDINLYYDKKPEVKSAMDFKTDTALSRMLCRFTVGYGDWRGVVGSPGA